MDFSKPDNARMVNRLKVLSALRATPQSRASLSKALSINKVSISEIAAELLEEGLIEESARLITAGRPATELKINEKSGRVIAIEEKSTSIGVSASDLLGNVLRFERFPRSEDDEENLKRTLTKLSSGVKLYGITLIGGSSPPIRDVPIVKASAVLAEAMAEIEEEEDYKKTLFVSWSDKISALYWDEGPIELSAFPHFKIAEKGTCTCGKTGHLEAISSGWAIRKKYSAKNLVTLASNDEALREGAMALGAVTGVAANILGAKRIVITGELSSASEGIYAEIKEAVSATGGDVPLLRARSPERGRNIGAGKIALERLFYHTDILDLLKQAEDLSF